MHHSKAMPFVLLRKTRGQVALLPRSITAHQRWAVMQSFVSNVYFYYFSLCFTVTVGVRCCKPKVSNALGFAYKSSICKTKVLLKNLHLHLRWGAKFVRAKVSSPYTVTEGARWCTYVHHLAPSVTVTVCKALPSFFHPRFARQLVLLCKTLAPLVPTPRKKLGKAKPSAMLSFALFFFELSRQSPLEQVWA